MDKVKLRKIVNQWATFDDKPENLVDAIWENIATPEIKYPEKARTFQHVRDGASVVVDSRYNAGKNDTIDEMKELNGKTNCPANQNLDEEKVVETIKKATKEWSPYKDVSIPFSVFGKPELEVFIKDAIVQAYQRGELNG